MSNSQTKIHPLNGLRGFAALWVVLFHACYGSSNGYLPGFSEKLDWGIWQNIIVQGPYAVDIFFILSGYILTHVHGKEFEKGLTLNTVKRFLSLRLARIYPLHLAVVVLLGGAYVTGLWNQKIISLMDVMLSVTLTNVWSNPSINTPAWSVSAEWMAYLAFPLIIPFLVRLRTSLWQFMGIAALSMGYPLCLMAFNWTWDWHFGGVALFRVLNGFVLGCLLYYFQPHCYFVKNSSHSDVWCLGFLLLLVSCLMDGASIVFIYALIPWVILTLAHAQHGIGKIFSNKAAMVLGTVSFSIYMVHYPVLEVFRMGLDDYYMGLIPEIHQGVLWMQLGFMLFSILAVSCLCYWSIEKPCREFVKQRRGSEQFTDNELVAQALEESVKKSFEKVSR